MAYERPAGVTLRLSPKSTAEKQWWMPNTPGRWLWRSPTHVEGRSEPVEYSVFERDGGLMLRRPHLTPPDPGYATFAGYDSIRMAPQGTWEWVTPTEDDDDSP